MRMVLCSCYCSYIPKCSPYLSAFSAVVLNSFFPNPQDPEPALHGAYGLCSGSNHRHPQDRPSHHILNVINMLANTVAVQQPENYSHICSISTQKVSAKLASGATAMLFVCATGSDHQFLWFWDVCCSPGTGVGPRVAASPGTSQAVTACSEIQPPCRGTFQESISSSA